MPQMFTVRWPLFARLEAVFFFPVAILLASEIAPVRTAVDTALVPELAPILHDGFGLPYIVIYWIAVGMIAFLPYFVGLLVTDRLLTVRKGYALLSFFAIATWAAAAIRLSDRIAIPLPDSLISDNGRLAFDQQTAIVAAVIAALTHAYAIWTGVRDDGDVAMRLIAAREEYEYSRTRPDQPGHAQDAYYRRTAQFRGWQPDKQLEGLGAGPRENSAVKVLSAITWVGVIIGMGFAWHNWNDFARERVLAPEVQAGPPLAPRGTNPATAAPAMPLAPVGPPQVNSHTVSIAALPAVQRPTEVSTNIQAAGFSIGPNEAIAERGGDGGFAFDAVVNGGHVQMLFDTGASVVGLRFEDAIRLGIPVSRLNYSAKVKTANGAADVAPITIDTVTVGNITLRAVQGFVAKQGMLQTNLLGQTFLARLAGYNVEKNVLVLRGH